MARAQTITYNGITLSLVYTNSVTSRAIYSSDNVDYLWTEFIIDIDCILNPEETSYISESVGSCLEPFESPGATPMETFEAIRHTLMQPRQAIDFGIFGTNIIVLADTPDVNNGPIPLACNVRRIVGGQVFYFNFIVKVHLIECPCPSGIIPLISNRFSQGQTINREMYTEITTTGEAYFRTDVLANTNETADAFRDQILPILPLYFHRERVRFNVNTAGNMITYEVVDVEKQYDLGETGPNGSGTFITNFEGSYNIQTIRDANGGILGGMQMATLTIKLWGGRPASRWVLVQTAFQIAGQSNKIPLNNVNSILRNLSISEDLAINYIELTISAQLSPINIGPIAGMQIAGLTVDQVLPNQNGINPQLYQNDGTAGSIATQLLSSALQDACAQPQLETPVPGTLQGSPVQSGPPPQTQVTPTPIIPYKRNNYSAPQTQYPYSTSRSDSYYNTSMGNMQLPIGTQVTTPYSPPPPPPGPSQCGSGSGNPTSTVVTLSNPVSTRRVVWTCERFGLTPQIPSPISSDPNQVLLDFRISPVSTVVLEDGVTPVFRVNGEYLYALKADVTQNPILSFDVVQWISYPYCNFAIDTTPGSNDSIHGLIDSAQQEHPAG